MSVYHCLGRNSLINLTQDGILQQFSLDPLPSWAWRCSSCPHKPEAELVPMFSKWLTHFALFSTIEIVGMRLENTWLFCLPQGRLGNEWSLLPGQRTDGCDSCETPRTIPQRYIRWKMQSKLLATAHQVEGQCGLGMALRCSPGTGKSLGARQGQIPKKAWDTIALRTQCDRLRSIELRMNNQQGRVVYLGGIVECHQCIGSWV